MSMAFTSVISNFCLFCLAPSAQVGTLSMTEKASLSTPASRERRTAASGAVKGVLLKKLFLPMTVPRRFWWTVTNYRSDHVSAGPRETIKQTRSMNSLVGTHRRYPADWPRCTLGPGSCPWRRCLCQPFGRSGGSCR